MIGHYYYVYVIIFDTGKVERRIFYLFADIVRVTSLLG